MTPQYVAENNDWCGMALTKRLWKWSRELELVGCALVASSASPVQQDHFDIAPSLDARDTDDNDHNGQSVCR